jgi:phosphatidate cytidylyltransferase
LASESRHTAPELGQAAPATPPASGSKEILLRVASAAVMAPAGLAAVWFGGIWIILATGACAVLASAEWTRMAAQTSGKRMLQALYAAMGIAAATTVLVAPLGFGHAALAALGGALLAGGVAWYGKGSVSSMAFGSIYTSLPFGAFVWIREATPDGRLTLLAILAIVWATDIAAYFAGRGFGGPLLSPKDSPNKTWNGAIGALVCACLAGAAVARAAGGDFNHWLAASFVLSIVAQAGDLLESRFKRLYGVKDTSGLVPGHGGVLDRLDALMAATLLSALALWVAPAIFPNFGGAGGQ